MKRFRTSLVAAVGIAIATATVTLTTGAQAVAQGAKPLLARIVNDAADPVPVMPVIPAADRVQLEMEAANNGECSSPSSRPVRRVFPDGTATSAFSVPPGQVLVLTDLEAVAVETAVPWIVGRVLSVVATIEIGSVPPQFSARAQINADAASAGLMPVSLHVNSGLVATGGTICVGAGVLSEGAIAAAGVQRAQLQGYLIAQ